MKRITAALLVLFAMLTALFSGVFASAEDVVTANITDFDGIGDDEDGDGLVYIYEGRSDGTRIIDSEKYNVRYMYVLVFDNAGHCVQIGNNLVFHSVDKSYQNFVVIPQGGFMLAFYYNTDFPTNIKLYEYYKTLSDLLKDKPEDTIYNRTLLIESNFTGSHDDSVAELHYGTYGDVLGDCTATDPESDEEPAGPGDESGDGSGEPGEDVPPPQNIPSGGTAAKITVFGDKCSCVNGEVAVVLNASGEDTEMLSEDYNLRYMHVMAFDADGNCTQVGNNLVPASESEGFQHGVTVPGGGFMLAFFYNTDNPANSALYGLYSQATDGAAIFNATVAPVRPLKAELAGFTGEGEEAIPHYVVVYPVAEGADPLEDSKEADTSSEDGAAVSETESQTVSESESGRESAAESQTESAPEASGPAASADESAAASAPESAPEKGGSGGNTGLIIGIAAAAAAVIAAAAIFVVKKKKK